MYDVLAGVRVVEVSQYAFVPAAGAVLADWGADVVKVVHPVYGDVMHTAHASNLAPLPDGTAYMWEIVNRGKRSIGIDLAHPDGLAVLHDLVREADVFVTNFLAPARQRLRIDVDDIRAVNPDVVYARGSGHGPKGPDAAAGGFDNVSFWARTGWAQSIAHAAGTFVSQPGPGSGDLPAGFALAAGVVAALYKRERTGVPAVVDVSLMAAGIWGMSGSIVASELYDLPFAPVRDRMEPGNALVGGFRTADGRYVFLSGMVHDQGVTDLFARLGRPDLVGDARFATAEARLAHHRDFVTVLDEAFASRPLDEWCRALDGMEVPWSVVRTAREVLSDPQTLANGYVQHVIKDSGREMPLTASPVQFDERPAELRAAPDPGQQTEEILLETGRDWDDIARLKGEGAVT
jgi:crotonobetainyl-CoA:carnitine CoA-transferase CaiB-like acyl-CoA transferase